MTPSERARAQQSLPGMAPVVDKDIHRLAGELYDVRHERMKLNKQEVELAEQLIFVMNEKGLDEYNDLDLELKVTIKQGKQKVKLRKIEQENFGAEGAEG